jgi:hypothetical protein
MRVGSRFKAAIGRIQGKRYFIVRDGLGPPAQTLPPEAPLHFRFIQALQILFRGWYSNAR